MINARCASCGRRYTTIRNAVLCPACERRARVDVADWVFSIGVMLVVLAAMWLWNL